MFIAIWTQGHSNHLWDSLSLWMLHAQCLAHATWLCGHVLNSMWIQHPPPSASLYACTMLYKCLDPHGCGNMLSEHVINVHSWTYGRLSLSMNVACTMSCTCNMALWACVEFNVDSTSTSICLIICLHNALQMLGPTRMWEHAEWTCYQHCPHCTITRINEHENMESIRLLMVCCMVLLYAWC
jgi:hypothetical protein